MTNTLPVYIINLPKDHERKKTMIEQCKQHGLLYDFFPGTYAKALSTDQIEEIYDKQKSIDTFGRELKIGEVGCTRSHFLLYEKIITDNIDYVCIMEDDVILDKKFITWLKRLNKKSLQGYDYIFANYTIFNKKNVLSYITYVQKQNWSSLKKLIHYVLLGGGIIGDIFWELVGTYTVGIAKRFKPLYLTGCYIISKQGAQKILSLHSKIFLPADHYVEKYHKKLGLKVGFIYPLLVSQREDIPSNIQG